jgi:UDP-N-acetylmuramoyl-L-alanyl-D-glutamate--2,6-diaminopimelate ligase
MRLGALVAGTDVRPISGSLDVDVAGIAIDSRRVTPGDVFFALTGRHTDGRRHVVDAVARGARAIVAHEAVDAGPATVLAATNPRAVLARVAARLAGDPSAHMTLVGVTVRIGLDPVNCWVKEFTVIHAIGHTVVVGVSRNNHRAVVVAQGGRFV